MRLLQLILSRNYVTNASVKLNTLQENIKYFKNIYSEIKSSPILYFDHLILPSFPGLSKRETADLLKNNPAIYLTNKDDIEDSYKMLTQLNIDVNNLAKHPAILNLKSNILENRYVSLKESGFKSIDLELLAKYLYIMNRSIRTLKMYDKIDGEFNVGEELIRVLNCPEMDVTSIVDEEDSLLKNRERLLINYFQHKLKMDPLEVETFKQNHVIKIRHKSFIQLTKCLHLLVQEFRFGNKEIIEHPFLLTADPNNMEKLLFEVKTIFGRDVRDIAMNRPIFLMTNWKSILEIIELLEKSNIPNSSLHYLLTLFALEPETVSQRLDELQSIEELNVLKEHPQILRLIYYQNKALHRLGYLKQMKVKCPSINVLSGHTEIFEKFVRSASDGSKSRQIIFYLSKLLDIGEEELKGQLNKHSQWPHISVLTLKNTVEYLFGQGFGKLHLRDNIIIVFYPM